MKEFSISREDLINNNYNNSYIRDVSENSSTSSMSKTTIILPEAIIAVILGKFISEEVI